MEKFMMDHQINTLFHFTQASNLPSIFKHGLLPKETLLSQCIDTEYNDDYRHDKCPNAICMSIEYPNYKMFFSLRCKNTNIDWVVIKIDASVLFNFLGGSKGLTILRLSSNSLFKKFKFLTANSLSKAKP